MSYYDVGGPRSVADSRVDGVAHAAVSSIGEWQRIMGRRPIGFRHSLGAGAPVFRARHESVSVGGSTVTKMRATAHRVQRVRGYDPTDAFVQIGLQISGRSCTRAGAHEVHAGPGDVLLYNADRDFSVAFGGNFQCVLLLVPRDTLGVAREAQELSVVRIPGNRGIGSVMANMLATLSEDLDVLTGAGADHVLAGVVSLVDGLVLEARDAGREPNPTVLDDVSAVIEMHLSDPELSPRLVAESLYMSVRSLQQQLARHGVTATQIIRDSRLDRARRILGDPADPREIRLVAEACGFVSASHFSREFSRRFGSAPRDFRRRHR